MGKYALIVRFAFVQKDIFLEDWNRLSSVSRPQKIDPSKLRLTKQYGEGEVQLGPARGFGPGGNWGKSSSGSGKNTHQQQDERQNTPTDKVAVRLHGSSSYIAT